MYYSYLSPSISYFLLPCSELKLFSIIFNALHHHNNNGIKYSYEDEKEGDNKKIKESNNNLVIHAMNQQAI